MNLVIYISNLNRNMNYKGLVKTVTVYDSYIHRFGKCGDIKYKGSI